MMNRKGAEDGLKNIFIGFIVLLLFTTLVLSAVMFEGNVYHKNTDQVIGGFNFSGFNNSITGLGATAQSSLKAFTTGDIFSPLTVAGIVATGIFSVGKTIINLVIAPFSLFANILTNVLQIPTYVTATILVILIFSLIFGLWRLVKWGS